MLAIWLLADDPVGITQTQALYGAVALIASGLLTFAGVVFTAVWQRKTADKTVKNEQKLTLFEEQDRLLERAREEADRARTEREEMRQDRDRIRGERDGWRRRAEVAEDQVEKWIERKTL